MKTFILAALAGVSVAQTLDNATDIVTDPISIFYDVRSGVDTEMFQINGVKTGWTKNGNSEDVQFDLKLWMDFGKSVEDFDPLRSKGSHHIAISNEDGTAYEAQKFEFFAHNAGVI